MKKIRFLLCIFIVSSIIGCSSSKDITKASTSLLNELGTSSITKNEISQINETELTTKINTCIDYLSYLETQTFSNSYEMIDQTYDLLYGDYEDIGRIVVYTDNKPYSLLYLKHNELIYTIDVYNQKNNFINRYSSIQEIEDYYKSQNNSNVVISSYCPDDYQLGDSSIFYLFGEKKRIYSKHGSKVYIFAGAEIPLDLGLPEYTDKEIQDIINLNDYGTVADKIRTLPDAINYIVHANFDNNYLTEDYLDYSTHTSTREDHATFLNPNGIQYDNENLFYIASGLEILQIRSGECATASALLTYLLLDDYEEVGYFSINYECDGHMMIYIKGNNHKYYLINAMDYFEYTADELINSNSVLSTWLGFYGNELGCTETLEELVKNFIESDAGLTPTNSELKRVVTWTDRNRLCYGFTILDDYLLSDMLLPTSASGTVWYGDIKIYYITPQVNTEQTYIMGFSKDRVISRN